MRSTEDESESRVDDAEGCAAGCLYPVIIVVLVWLVASYAAWRLTGG